MIVSQQCVADYARDGFLLVENVFTEEEVAVMLREVEGGDRVAQTTMALADASSKSAKLAIWSDLGDDVWAAASTNPRLVNNVRILMGEDISFFHGKVMMKEAHSGGAWEWHQDYGYWYDQGFIFPRMISAFVALDAATLENGCLQVLRGSHRLGRLSHGNVGTQTGADTERLEQIQRLFERVHCTMKPGSVLYFDCNLLHASSSNESDFPRRSFIGCYNALANPKLGEVAPSLTVPCPVSNEGRILDFK